MNFTLKIMGTASAMPISNRNPSAQALIVHGRLFLIDCGEGMQQQMRRMHLSFVKAEALFISHIHGDHLFGLFGLLSSMAMYGRTGDLHIFAPHSFGPILKFFLSYFGEGVNFRIIHNSLESNCPEVVYEGKSVRVTAFPLHHKIDCYGFRFDEILSAKALKSDPDRKPLSYAYCSDTAPFPELAECVRGVSVLYHEATYTDDMADKAAFRYHSTTRQAALCAQQADVGKLIVGHYSSRISDFDAYLAECREIFPETYAARDGDIFEI